MDSTWDAHTVTHAPGETEKDPGLQVLQAAEAVARKMRWRERGEGIACLNESRNATRVQVVIILFLSGLPPLSSQDPALFPVRILPELLALRD